MAEGEVAMREMSRMVTKSSKIQSGLGRQSVCIEPCLQKSFSVTFYSLEVVEGRKLDASSSICASKFARKEACAFHSRSDASVEKWLRDLLS